MREYETLSEKAAAVIEDNQRKDIRIALMAAAPLIALGAAFVTLCLAPHGHVTPRLHSRRPPPTPLAHSLVPESRPDSARS